MTGLRMLPLWLVFSLYAVGVIVLMALLTSKERRKAFYFETLTKLGVKPDVAYLMVYK